MTVVDTLAEEAINNSLERLHISGEDKDVNDVRHCSYPQSSLGEEEEISLALENSVDVEQSLSPPPSPPIIICDAWYGFPSQKRPRKERINAVSRQLSNFIQWRSSSSLSSKSSAKDTAQQNNCKVSLLGSEGDVQAVNNRMGELVTSNAQSTSTTCSNNEVEFQPNVAIHEFINKETKHNTNNEEDDSDTIVYLSPDASHTLSSTRPPPRIVIIGMLIDRRITTDRSRIRAEETLNIKAVKLPLDELNTKELTSHEPLNVDTCMELMQRWWWNCDQLVLPKKEQEEQKEQSNNEDNNDEEEESRDIIYRKCFIDAAARAMKTQRERHPNRTVHITNKG